MKHFSRYNRILIWYAWWDSRYKLDGELLMTNRIEAQTPGESDLSKVKMITDQEEITDTYALYLDDESHSFEGQAEKIVFPITEGDVSSILKDAYENGTPVTIQGGRTGLTGAAVPMGGIALNLEKMEQFSYMNYSSENNFYTIAADAGVLLEDLVKHVISKDLDFLKGKGTSDQQAALEKLEVFQKDLPI